MKLLNLCCLIILPVVCPLRAADWNQWRGPQRDGIARGWSLPDALPEKLEKVWSIQVGSGHSSPLLNGDKLFLLSRLNDQETVSCINTGDGSLIWRKNYAAPFEMNAHAIRHGKGPKSTPLLSGGKLYTLGISGILTCFDSQNGEIKWQKQHFKDQPTDKEEYTCVPCYKECDKLVYDKPGPCPGCKMELARKGLATGGLFYGVATSPIAVDGMVITHNGNADKGAIIAYDAESGTQKWIWENQGPGYSSAMVIERHGVRQLVDFTRNSFVGLELATGKKLWELPFPDMWNENVATPVEAGELLILSNVRSGTKAVRINRDGQQWKPTVVWDSQSVFMFMSSPVLLDGKFYGLSDKKKGQFVCVDAATGKDHWKSKGREGANAALIAVGDRILATTTNGELVVFAADPTAYRQLAKWTVAESPIWAYPALMGSFLFTKDQTGLTCWKIGK